ncbi:leucine-rich repeat and calponin homology domain-containing protein 4 isoform X4 [Lepisosteus oculatus]|uniref:leucine-rich repeat and calponin homology domain-containing protein 4 isoform X4 n=1 Tax=Lepisosteus oculatus TaxID=7918 RepID=UPI00370F8047
MAAGDDSPLPASIAASRSVEKALEEAAASGALSLSNRKLKEFPRTARNYDLSDITHADLSKNRLSEVPEELCQFISLETLSLYHNCIRSIPPSIGNLQALTYLNISRNQLSSLPTAVCELPLRVLIASNNKLPCLPSTIQALGNLRQLDVSCNELQSLPPEIGLLESLRDLNLRRNHLTTLPEELSELPLVRLDVSCNRVTRVPVCYRHLRHLQTITLDNNPLQSPPAQICTKGKIHIFKYLNIEACSKTTPEEFDRALRPAGINSCLSDQELFPARQYGGLDSGFNSVDSGSKRWSGNESADDFSDLSLRMAEISREQRNLREERPVHSLGDRVNGEAEQEDFIDSSVTEEDEEEHRSLPSPHRTAPPQEKSGKTGLAQSESPDRGLSVSLLKSTAKTGSGSTSAAQTGSGPSGSSFDSGSSIICLRQRCQSTDQPSSSSAISAPVRSTSRTDTPPMPNPAGSPGAVQKPNSFLFRAQSRTNVKPTGSVQCLVETGRSESKASLLRSPREEREGIAQLRKTLESRLKITLPEDLGEALSDGAILCQLANHVRPRSVSIIHIPSPAVPKLSAPKCRRNVENFITACRKLGIPETEVCASSDVLCSNLPGVLRTVEALTRLGGCVSPHISLLCPGFLLFYSLAMGLLYLSYCQLTAC